MKLAKGNDAWVAVFIFLAAGLIFLIGWCGEFRNYAGPNPPPPLFPALDKTILDNAEWTIFPYFGISLVFLIVALKCKGSILPKIGNTILFIQLIGGAFFWTAHTGGLSAGLYGAGYLSLCSVAWIVPNTWRVRLITSTPVAVGAIILAMAVPHDRKKELFICVCCLLGTSSAALIKWVLEDSDTTTDGPRYLT